MFAYCTVLFCFLFHWNNFHCAIRNLCLIDIHGYVPCVVVTIFPFFLYHRQIFNSLAVTQQLPLAEQKKISLQGTQVHPRYLVGFVLLNIWFFLQYFVEYFVCQFPFGHCVSTSYDLKILITPLASSRIYDLLRLTSSEYPCGISKLFFLPLTYNVIHFEINPLQLRFSDYQESFKKIHLVIRMD